MYQWTEELATGVEEIDNQHKEIFARLNSLLEACNRQKGREEVASYLSFLEDYVAEHFLAEEVQMKAFSYPGLAEHREQHLTFVKQIATIKREFNEYGSAIHVLLMAVRTSGEWLANHIKKTDKAMAGFLRTQRTS